MGKPATSAATLPAQADEALKALGENLKVARLRRGEGLRSWAARMDTSVPTLRRMEAGDPTVGIGVYVTALWLCGQVDRLPEIIRAVSDDIANEQAAITVSKGKR